MNACFMYHLLYQINKFKKEIGDKWMPVHIPLVSIKLINSKMKMVTNECLFMYHLLYQINKFKNENGDKWMPVHVSIASIIIINSKRYLETNNKLF